MSRRVSIAIALSDMLDMFGAVRLSNRIGWWAARRVRRP